MPTHNDHLDTLAILALAQCRSALQSMRLGHVHADEVAVPYTTTVTDINNHELKVELCKLGHRGEPAETYSFNVRIEPDWKDG